MNIPFDELPLVPRWVDHDPAGHVTDTAYPIYLGEARGLYMARRVGPFTQFPCVLVEARVSYRNEIRFPSSQITVRTRITDVGRSSIAFEQEIVRNDGETAAVSTSTLVAFDLESRRSRTIGDDDREKLLS